MLCLHFDLPRRPFSLTHEEIFVFFLHAGLGLLVHLSRKLFGLCFTAPAAPAAEGAATPWYEIDFFGFVFSFLSFTRSPSFCPFFFSFLCVFCIACLFRFVFIHSLSHILFIEYFIRTDIFHPVDSVVPSTTTLTSFQDYMLVCSVLEATLGALHQAVYPLTHPLPPVAQVSGPAENFL